MKRSEMRALIRNQFLKHQHCCNDWNIAEYILNAVENAGMLPPDYFANGWDNMFDAPVKIRIRNSWEPDNQLESKDE